MNVLGLFSGVGGLELGLEWAGMTTVGHVERDPYCQAVLHHHWPAVPLHDDVTTCPAWWASEERPTVDLICAGFPCQPFSHAGKRLGVNDERWMWPATADVIRAVRPRFVLLENVSALVRDAGAFGAVLGDLHSLGFDAEWATLRASDYGAPQNRERLYLLAYTASDGRGAHDYVVSGRGWRAPFAVGGLPRLSVHERRRAASAWLERQPRVDRLVDGIPAQVDRLRCAGNAAVPQIAEFIGRQLIERLEQAA